MRWDADIDVRVICEENVDQNFKHEVQIRPGKVRLLEECLKALGVAQKLDKGEIRKDRTDLVELVQRDTLLEDQVRGIPAGFEVFLLEGHLDWLCKEGAVRL